MDTHTHSDREIERQTDIDRNRYSDQCELLFMPDEMCTFSFLFRKILN